MYISKSHCWILNLKDDQSAHQRCDRRPKVRYLLSEITKLCYVCIFCATIRFPPHSCTLKRTSKIAHVTSEVFVCQTFRENKHRRETTVILFHCIWVLKTIEQKEKAYRKMSNAGVKEMRKSPTYLPMRERSGVSFLKRGKSDDLCSAAGEGSSASQEVAG